MSLRLDQKIFISKNRAQSLDYISARMIADREDIRRYLVSIGAMEGKGTRKTPWTADQIQILSLFYSSIDPKVLAYTLGKTYNAILLKAQVLGLKSSATTPDSTKEYLAKCILQSTANISGKIKR